MRIYSYVVARDYGFAPNPFFGICTLATCKPNTRRVAQIGDWIVGTGTASRKRSGYLVYAMRVTQVLTFDEYWNSADFQRKKPNLRGSKKVAFGDNIYHKSANGKWLQIDSHHSYKNGVPNNHNIKNDTQTDRLLASNDYAYWGGFGPAIPKLFRNFEGFDICARRNHKSLFPVEMVTQFVAWFRSLDAHGFIGPPLDWDNTP